MEILKGQGISVIMPTYKHASTIARSIKSLQLQTYQNWELIIINDGSPDNTEHEVARFLNDKRITYHKNNHNRGLGFCLNQGIDLARHSLVAYLPSDDIYFHNHLRSLADTLVSYPNAIASIASVRHHYATIGHDNVFSVSNGKIEGFPLQLVQVLHKRSADRWSERQEIVTDDLDKMFWNKLQQRGSFVRSNNVSCEWIEHPKQRHKLINEKYKEGGIYPYKVYYKVSEPVKFQSMSGNLIDEVTPYKFSTSVNKIDPNGLKILLVGELAYNPERIMCFEERGHKLYGLWLDKPYHFNTVGPLPFGNVETIDYENWREKVREIKPDVIYALLNGPAITFAHKILKENPGIPFVWHFKEGPFHCRQDGTWDELIELYNKSDGQIYINKEMEEWFSQFLPDTGLSFILDGDLPKKNNQTPVRSVLLSDNDGEVHTVVSGRPMGINIFNIKQLADEKIHFHFYGDLYQVIGKEAVEAAKSVANRYFHLHPHCTQDNWVKEFSQYDAGWLHIFQSDNNNELIKATWYDLNFAARISTLAMAGVPMIQKDNSGHIVATQNLTKQLEIGVFYKTITELGMKLRDKRYMSQLRENTWESRDYFTFDSHVDALIEFFKKVIQNKRDRNRETATDFLLSANTV